MTINGYFDHPFDKNGQKWAYNEKCPQALYIDKIKQYSTLKEVSISVYICICIHKHITEYLYVSAVKSAYMYKRSL